MLNTDAHNQAIAQDRKMTKEQFVSNNRGINNGKDLEKNYLEELYDKIKANAFAMDHERDEFNQWLGNVNLSSLFISGTSKGGCQSRRPRQETAHLTKRRALVGDGCGA